MSKATKKTASKSKTAESKAAAAKAPSDDREQHEPANDGVESLEWGVLALAKIVNLFEQGSHLSRTRFPQCKRGIGILVARAEVSFHQEVGVDDWDRNVVVDPSDVILLLPLGPQPVELPREQQWLRTPD